MRLTVLVLSLATLVAPQSFSQSPDTWIVQGRSYLAARDMANANASFAKAVALSPTNQTANAFYAVTRLLVLPSQPAGSNFLTRIGIPVAGRNIYNWTAMPAEDTNGVPLAPPGVGADEFNTQLRTNVLLAITGAISNLRAVVATNFTIALSSNETSIAAVSVDYGDLKLLQAALYAAEYSTYTLNGANLHAQLETIRTLFDNGRLSAGQLLATYPELFTPATTNDLPSACVAFTNAVNTYLLASDFIRARPTNQVRLFNFDPARSRDEGNFRLTLQDLKNSLVLGPQIFALSPDIYLDMSPTFDGSLNLRRLLPAFQGNAIALGTLPDPTFHGVAYGLTIGDEESALAKRFTMLPVGRAPQPASGGGVALTFSTLRGHTYLLETSTNLGSWQPLTFFTAAGETSTVTDPHVPGVTQRFYRLRDDTGFVVLTGVR
jgi:hypothetical protein